MFGVIIRSLCAGVAALLLVQGNALGATVQLTFAPGTDGDQIDAELVLGSPPEFFGPGPDHNPAVTTFPDGGDYVYLDFNLASELVTSEMLTVSGTSGPLLADFTLTMFVADITTNPGFLEFDDAAPLAPGAVTAGMLSQTLTMGDYVLRVQYNSSNGASVGTYTGQITATPLPPAMLIFGTGLFGLGILSRYRRRRRGQLGLEA